jgi:stearoyl-CoA desaturase (Delta-9 desaturase)
MTTDVQSTPQRRKRAASAIRMLWVTPAITVIVPLAAVLAAPFVWISYGIRPQDAVGLTILYCLGMLGITLGYHRLLAHRALTMIAAARSAIVALGAMSAQGPPTFWVAHHRAHHGDPDGPRDPHSPTLRGSGRSSELRGFFHGHIGWMFGQAGRYDASLVRDVRNDPVVRWIENHYLLVVLSGLFIPAILLLPLDPTLKGFIQTVYWAGLFRIGLGHQATWLVNSACHLWGYRNFQTKDGARNNWIVAALTLGEGWHNNHHADPSSARHGRKWWELDPTHWIILLLEVLGLARNVRDGRDRGVVR